MLYDLKLIDDALHRYWVGASNKQILANAGRLAGYNVQVRVPLIPGITDTDANLHDIFTFMRQSGLGRVALLPYNPSAGAKYEWLGVDYAITAAPQTTDALQRMGSMAEQAGLQVEIH